MNTAIRERTREYLEAAESQSGPCLTISLACDSGGRNHQMHRERLRHEIRNLRKANEKNDQSDKGIGPLLEKAEAFVSDGEQWSGDYEGVCIHISNNVDRFLKLPYPPVEVSALDDSFRLRPAADAIAALGDWLVLHITLKSPRLFRYDGQKAELLGEVDLPESVYSFSEDWALDPGQHAHVRQTRGHQTPQMVNQSMSPAESPRELNEPIFMREVAHALGEVAESKTLPMLVVGDEQVVSSFLKTYRHQGGEVATVTDADAHPDEGAIARMCGEVAWRSQQERKGQVLATIEEMHGREGVFSDNVREVFEASCHGRVAAAAVACDDDIWCRIDKDEKPRSTKPDDEGAFEALDRIYLETLMKDGQAIVLPRDEIPGGKSVAAVFRW